MTFDETRNRTCPRFPGPDDAPQYGQDDELELEREPDEDEMEARE